jgi:hypothetical protein
MEKYKRMSGGYFNYNQDHIQSIAEDIETLIFDNDSEELTNWGDKKGHGYSPETIEEFKIGVEYLRKAAVYAQRIDWLVSGDDGEDTFHNRLQKDLKKIEE